MRRTRTATVFSALAVLALASAATAFPCGGRMGTAQGCGPARGRVTSHHGSGPAGVCGYGGLEEMACLLRCVDVTDAQAEELQSILEEAQDRIYALTEDCHEGDDALCHDAAGLVSTPVTSEEIEEMVSARVEMIRERAEIMAGVSERVRNVLTQEQLESLASLESEDCDCSGGGCH
ncbi:MAG: Spy/CpxP family protein refolding chaperone [Candidatus Fermentibacteraceae bacterium]